MSGFQLPSGFYDRYLEWHRERETHAPEFPMQPKTEAELTQQVAAMNDELRTTYYRLIGTDFETGLLAFSEKSNQVENCAVHGHLVATAHERN